MTFSVKSIQSCPHFISKTYVMTIKASLLSWSNVAKATVASLTIATAVHLARDPEDVQKLPHQISMTVKSVEDIISKKFGQLD